MAKVRRKDKSDFPVWSLLVQGVKQSFSPPDLTWPNIMDRGYTASPLNNLGCVITEIKQADQYCDNSVCGNDSGLLTLLSRMRKDNVMGPWFFFSTCVETAKLYRRRKTSWRSNSVVESFSSRGHLCWYWVFEWYSYFGVICAVVSSPLLMLLQQQQQQKRTEIHWFTKIDLGEMIP